MTRPLPWVRARIQLQGLGWLLALYRRLPTGGDSLGPPGRNLFPGPRALTFPPPCPDSQTCCSPPRTHSRNVGRLSEPTPIALLIPTCIPLARNDQASIPAKSSGFIFTCLLLEMHVDFQKCPTSHHTSYSHSKPL